MIRETSDRQAEELAQNCRLWKMEGDETFQDISDALTQQELPVAVSGRVFEPHQLIQDINVADGECLILEWKIALEKSSKMPYAYDP